MTIRPFTAAITQLFVLAQLPTIRAQAELYTWEPSQPGSHFGTALAEVGDIDLDGVPEVLVGSPSEVSGQGTLRVYSGRTGEVLRTYAGSVLEHLGSSVANAGDVDDDGWDDMLVGASPTDFFGPLDAHVRGSTRDVQEGSSPRTSPTPAGPLPSEVRRRAWVTSTGTGTRTTRSPIPRPSLPGASSRSTRRADGSRSSRGPRTR